MANKKLGTSASELKLPTKKVKGEKKPKWQAKMGKKMKAEPVVETPDVAEPVVDESPTLPPEHADVPEVTTTPGDAGAEPTAPKLTAPTTESVTPPEPTVPDQQTHDVAELSDEPAPKKPRKLKVKADLKPKKLSMIKAALQVLQDRKMPMTCPELIDVMATEDLWTSPGGKTPAATLYAALARSIKDLGKASEFRKTERGKFEKKILPKE
ncbi:MAG TPA: HTH domain-containing protein [Gemmatales bacterium]|nr:HTH domain-containing protein [Gemmatales bacterium]